MADMSLPKWLKDIRHRADAAPFGVIEAAVHKKDNRVVEMTVTTNESVRYPNNEQALTDIEHLLETLTASNYDGQVTFTATVKQGTIRLISYQSQKRTQYTKD